LNGKPGTLSTMPGADDGAALDTAAPAFKRDYGYDTHLRPTNDTILVNGGTTTVAGWDPESFTVGLAYDGNYGRMKGIAFPSGEVVALDYDPNIGFPTGETPVVSGGGRDQSNHYRRGDGHFTSRAGHWAAIRQQHRRELYLRRIDWPLRLHLRNRALA
jgi:hypothetical protein